MGWMLPGWRLLVVVASACALSASPAWAEGPGLAVQRVDASQFPTVRVSTSVANSSGVPITGLDARAFQVQEDGKPVDGLTVEPVVESQEPISIALVIDTSGSMADESKLDRAKTAGGAFVDALGPADRVTIVNFADQVSIAQDYSSDRNALKSAIGGLTAGGNTLLYDAIAQTAQRQAAQPEHRKTLILLTDGEDTKSASSLENSIAAATSAGSPVYAIGLGSDVNRDVLDRVASATGGQAVYLDDSAQLQATFLSISDQLRRQYVLRYTSRLAPDAHAHGLAIQVTYSGQSATGLGSFSTPAPPSAWTVAGLPASGPVTGVQHVAVDVPGDAQLVQLLVDDQVRATVRTAPFVLDWDVQPESVGPHHVVVRVTDTQGVASDKSFSLSVAPAPVETVPAATTTPAATASAVATATPVADNARPVDAGVVTGGALLVFVLICLLAWHLAAGRRRRSNAGPATRTVPQSAPPKDMTEVVQGATASGDETSYRPRSAAGATARLLIARGGEQHEVLLDEPEATVGRDDEIKVPIKDPQASRKHARIFQRDGHFWVEDLGSLNGTHVNGESVKCRQLASKDRIGIGETVLTFVVAPHHS